MGCSRESEERVRGRTSSEKRWEVVVRSQRALWAVGEDLDLSQASWCLSR